MTRFFLHILPGLAVSLLGAFVFAGEWVRPHWPELHATAAMHIGLNSALCFVLAGAALLLDARRSPMERRLQLACGAVIFAIALAVLFQLALDAYPVEAGWRYLLSVRMDPGEPLAREGTMGAAMAVAFILCGASLILLAATDSIPSGLAAQCTAAAMICVALVGVFSGTLGNILFYEQGPGHTLIILPTAAVISVLSMGLYLRVTDAPWFRQFYREREDIRLFVTGSALFALTAFLTGLTTIGIVGRYAMSNFQESLERSFHSAASAFRFSADMAIDRSIELVSLSTLPELVRTGASRERINHEVDRILKVAGGKDMAAITIVDIDGKHVGGTAFDVPADQWSALVPAPALAYLYWDNRWRLRIHVPLQAGGRAAGSAIVHANLDLWDDQFNRIQHFGASGESCLCLREGDQQRCFPAESAGAGPNSSGHAAGRKGRSFAMQSALSGRGGVAIVKDYRGNDVVAAFGPLAPRLGLVLKVDTDEFYAPLRRQLWIALSGLALLFFIGAAILYWRTRPLVKGLVHARARLDAILNNVPAGVLISNRDGKIESANRTAEQMFDYGAGELAGTDIKNLLHSGTISREVDESNAQVLAGRRKDGMSFPAAAVTREFFLE
ncbi:MAG: PAS domain-containing protein, partial [Bacillota bacterium]